MNEADGIKNDRGEVLKAGGVVMHAIGGVLCILMVYRAKYSDWSFPKGHVERGETAEQTALREIREECGIEAEIIRSLPTSTYWNARRNEAMSASMYLLRPITFELKAADVGDAAEWVPIDRVREKLTRENLQTYFDAVYPEIKEMSR